MHGAFVETSQYWVQYIEMIKLYHGFIRSIRVGDFELYVCCLPKLSNIFFAFNHINYARWLTRCHDNLLKLPETHPSVYAEFKDGLFSIKRINKSFSGIPTDLTLEQITNAIAACQRTAMVNSNSARQRWAQSYYIKTSMISYLYESLGITKKEDVTKELKP